MAQFERGWAMLNPAQRIRIMLRAEELLEQSGRTFRAGWQLRGWNPLKRVRDIWKHLSDAERRRLYAETLAAKSALSDPDPYHS